VPIDSIHVATPRLVETEALAFDRPATPALLDDHLGHRIYELASPLLPGGSMRLDFEVHVQRRGFGEDGADVSIVPNGTWFTQHWLPAIGYQSSRELLLHSDRREQGLAARRVIPSFCDADAPQGQWTGHHARDGAQYRRRSDRRRGARSSGAGRKGDAVTSTTRPTARSEASGRSPRQSTRSMKRGGIKS
jgi:hypothetical protein